MKNTSAPLSHCTLEHLAYGGLFALALWLRWHGLGHTPLGEQEAAQALAAWHWRWGAPLGPSPLYTLWTAATFFLFGATDATARWIPALTGATLALLPWAWRKPLGRPVALLTALGLALDPTLVALSRQAGGAALGLFWILLGATLWWQGRVGLGSAWLTLGLFAGRPAVFGVAVLGLTAGLARLLRIDISPRSPSTPAHHVIWANWAGVLLAVTLLGAAPGGLGGLFVGTVAFLQGWVQAGWAGPGWPLLWAGLLNAWATVLGGIGIIQAWREKAAPRWMRLAALWALTGWVLAVLYPARTAAEAAWTLPPLYALAAATLWGMLNPFPSSKIVWAHAGLITVLGAYLWLLGTGIEVTPVAVPARLRETLLALGLNANTAWLRWILLTLGVGVILLGTLLIGLGWSRRVAWQGLLWGLTLLSVPLTLRYTALATQGTPERNPWAAAPAGPGLRLLQHTVAQIAEMRYGRPARLDLLLLQPPSSVRWALRSVEGAQIVDILPRAALPDALVTPASVTDPQRGVAYRGQDFLVSMTPLSQRVQQSGWARWFFLGEAPPQGQRVILWVRSDVFPGGVLQEVSPSSNDTTTTP